MELADVFDIGRHVQCDWCDTVYSQEDGTVLDTRTGGFLFGSKATGPCCAAQIEEGARRHGETEFITERCPADMPFHAWVYQLRDGDNEIRVWTGDPK